MESKLPMSTYGLHTLPPIPPVHMTFFTSHKTNFYLIPLQRTTERVTESSIADGIVNYNLTQQHNDDSFITAILCNVRYCCSLLDQAYFALTKHTCTHVRMQTHTQPFYGPLQFCSGLPR